MYKCEKLLKKINMIINLGENHSTKKIKCQEYILLYEINI